MLNSGSEFTAGDYIIVSIMALFYLFIFIGLMWQTSHPEEASKSHKKMKLRQNADSLKTLLEHHTVTLQDILDTFKDKTWLLTVSGVCVKLESGAIKFLQEADYENYRDKKVKEGTISHTEKGLELIIYLEE